MSAGTREGKEEGWWRKVLLCLHFEWKSLLKAFLLLLLQSKESGMGGAEWGWVESFPMNGFAGNNTISL